MASSSRAGGRATEAGMTFQADVGTWFAAHLVSEMPIGALVGLSGDAVPLEIQFETGRYLDDILVRLSDGGALYVQCKTHPNLSAAPDSPLTATIEQLVALFTSLKTEAFSTRPNKSAAVLAVASDASGSLDDLDRACRFFDLGGRWADAKATVSQAQVRALEVFETSARAAWSKIVVGPMTEPDLTGLARLFHVVRFDVGPGGRDWREGVRLVGSRLFGREEAGAAPLGAISKAVRTLMRNGATANRDGFIAAIRSEGFEDIRSPRYDRDVERLKSLSKEEVSRLSRHSRLPIGGGIPIVRDCAAPLKDAAESGSLLVVGEPGSGKTGVLINMAGQRFLDSAPTVFLSVDRLAGVATNDDLQDELRLEHPFLEVLAAWPGRRPGLLFIDALDASRGGPSELVFGRLIEDAVARLGERWSVIASIRTFDLQNGRRFRAVMAGAPPAAAFSEPGLDAVRHFRIPRLSDEEVRALAKVHPELGRLAETAPPLVQKLLRNVFNLSLAAELVAQGVSADSIRTVATQSDLIDRYEDERLPTSRLQAATAKAVQVMVERRRLTVPRITVTHDAVDEVLNTGVLVSAGDRVAFAHHVLFDHAAGRFFLDWDDSKRLKVQVSNDPTIGLLLGPALRFAMERVWREDSDGHPTVWGLVVAVTSDDSLDPVVASVVLRTAAEGVEQPKDVEALCGLIQNSEHSEALGKTLSRLARFVSMSIEERGSIDAKTAEAWAIVAQVASATRDRKFADGARFFLWALFERADFSTPTFAAAFGAAARSLLEFAWDVAQPMPVLATNAIRFVAKTFHTDPAASRTLLDRILEEPRFSAHAHEEAPWLAEGVPAIIPVDADFAVKIYAVLYGRGAPQDGKSWLGGVPSRIMPLSSNRRQDYEHARWHLGRALPSFLRSSAARGTQAVSVAVIGSAFESHSQGQEREIVVVETGVGSLTIVDDHLSLQDWRGKTRQHSEPGEDTLVTFVNFLRECTEADFRAAIESAMNMQSATSVWARLFGIGIERPGVADDLLWPVASSVGVLDRIGLFRDAILYLGKVYPNRSVGERTYFENELLARTKAEVQTSSIGWSSIAARFLSIVPEEALVTSEIRKLKSDLGAEGRLVGNRPVVSIEIGAGSAEDYTDRHLEGEGVNLQEGPDHEVRAAAKKLEDLLRERNENIDSARVVELWTSVCRLVQAINENVDPAPHSETLHTSWGSVSNAIEIIAKADTFSPKDDRHPNVDELLDIVDRMLLSPYPEPRAGGDSGGMSWGNWDVRVYAASGLMALARRFGGLRPEIVERLPHVLEDRVPAVRLQVAQSLNALWDIARPAMWGMMQLVAEKEENLDVLGFYVAGPLVRISGVDAARCEELVSKILSRMPQDAVKEDSGKRNYLEESIGHLAARLWVGQARSAARGWIDEWTTDLVRKHTYLWHTISALRGALFVRFTSDASAKEVEIQNRAREILHAIITAAAEALGKATPLLSSSQATEKEQQAAEKLYRAGDRLLEHACNQLYFGAGVFKGREKTEPPGLKEPEAMRAFLDEYSTTLDLIGQAGTYCLAVGRILARFAYVHWVTGRTGTDDASKSCHYSGSMDNRFS